MAIKDDQTLRNYKFAVISIVISVVGLVSGFFLVRFRQDIRRSASEIGPVMYFVPTSISVPVNSTGHIYEIYLDTKGYEVNGLVYEINYDTNYIKIEDILEGEVLYQVVAHSVYGGTAFLEVKLADDKPFVGQGVVARVLFTTKGLTTPSGVPTEFQFGKNSNIHTRNLSASFPVDTPPGYINITTGQPTPTLDPSPTPTSTPALIPTPTPTAVPPLPTNTPMNTPTPTIAQCTMSNGDANGDGVANGNDFTAWLRNFSTEDPLPNGPSTADGDFNCDGYVNGNDFTTWLRYFTP